MAQVHIAHNVQVGERCLLAGQSGVAGSTTLGDGAMVGGQAGIAQHLDIGSGAQIMAKSMVIRNVTPGAKVGAYSSADFFCFVFFVTGCVFTPTLRSLFYCVRIEYH
jgi:UDP-3-O-[3-hydroxymyristoyl] glucosamine N-acyltransferase